MLYLLYFIFSAVDLGSYVVCLGQVIVYDHGQVMVDPSLIGRVGFTGIWPSTPQLQLQNPINNPDRQQKLAVRKQTYNTKTPYTITFWH